MSKVICKTAVKRLDAADKALKDAKASILQWRWQEASEMAGFLEFAVRLERKVANRILAPESNDLVPPGFIKDRRALDFEDKLLSVSSRVACSAVRIYNIIREVGRGELSADNALHQLVEDYHDLRSISDELRALAGVAEEGGAR